MSEVTDQIGEIVTFYEKRYPVHPLGSCEDALYRESLFHEFVSDGLAQISSTVATQHGYPDDVGPATYAARRFEQETRSRLQRNRQAFTDLLNDPVRRGEYEGRYVAIWDAHVLDSDEDPYVLARRLREKQGRRVLRGSILKRVDWPPPSLTGILC